MLVFLPVHASIVGQINAIRFPEGRDVDGRPVWEPQIFNYSRWIGDECDKTRAAVMKWICNDVAKTTDILDVDAEKDLVEFRNWIQTEIDDSSPRGPWGQNKKGDLEYQYHMSALEQDYILISLK